MKFNQHPQAIVESEHIGPGTNVWAFAHILPGAVVGAHCNICDHVFIENNVRIGDRVTIKCGVQLWDGIIIEDDVFIGPNATFANDPYPRSRQYPEKFEKTIIRQGASIGANATILGGMTIGKNSMVGAGAVVTRDVPPNAVVIGNPSVIKGYVDSENSKKTVELRRPSWEVPGAHESVVAGVRIFKLPLIQDIRGNLTVAEYGQYLPFVAKRIFLVFEVPSREVRGEHAHHHLHQFLQCVRGSCSLVVDDGHHREEILLDTPTIGVYIPPMVWGIHYKYSADAMLLVAASDVYNPEDYIRDYDEFLSLLNP
jgi:UDP-2-acetamido-3-amino-2,3-dideoxy-glucuronate N-acetyltransferase